MLGFSLSTTQAMRRSEQLNPGSRQDIYRFPDSRSIFWSNPGSLKYPSRPRIHAPCSRMMAEFDDSWTQIVNFLPPTLNFCSLLDKYKTSYSRFCGMHL